MESIIRRNDRIVKVVSRIVGGVGVSLWKFRFRFDVLFCVYSQILFWSLFKWMIVFVIVLSKIYISSLYIFNVS